MTADRALSDDDVPGALEVDPDRVRWDEEVDVAIVGFGGAGVCAALQAIEEGASVLAIDRFDGGGATAVSGGIVYAGGGTRHQIAAGFHEDSADNMYAYLKQEVGEVVRESTLRSFCRDSASNLEWMEDHGAVFSSAYCPEKTSYPVDRYTLYYSGNERLAPFRDTAAPAPRGHRPVGTGLPGGALYRPLRRAAIAGGVRARYQSRVTKLLMSPAGHVVGVELRSLKPGGPIARWHLLLHRVAGKIALAMPRLAERMRAAIARLEARHGRTSRVRVHRGTVLSTGGFIMNREMVDEYAPRYSPAMPLGVTGCDGSGIRMGIAAGGLIDRMERVSAWRFINPPLAFTAGVIVDRKGERYANETWYGAAIARRMVEEHDGAAILILDRRGAREANEQSRPGKARWFQWVPALLNLHVLARRGDTIEAVAEAAGVDPAGLRRTLAEYNDIADGKRPDPFGKDPQHLRRLEPPFIAIDCSIDAPNFPCPALTLGGLVVDECTGQVRRARGGGLIGGLYAAGRTAVGISSENYVSGLSVADCCFSGRRAGRHAARSLDARSGSMDSLRAS